MLKRGKYRVARLFFGRACELADINEGPSGRTLLWARFYYGLTLGFLGRYAEAEAELRAVWEIERRPEILGEEHPETLATRANIAQQMSDQGRYAAAEAEFRAVWEIRRRPEILGEEHPYHLRTKFWLAKVLDGQGKRDQASQLLDGLIEEMTAHFDKHHVWIRELESYLSERRPD